MLNKVLVLPLLILSLISCQDEKSFTPAKIIPTKIDSLKTNAELEKYIGDSDSLYRKFTLKKIQELDCNGCDSVLVNFANRLKVDFTYQKVDFDNNGYTDLLAIGDNNTYTPQNIKSFDVVLSRPFNVIAIMNFGNETKLNTFGDDFYGVVPKIEYLGSRPLLAIYFPRVQTVSGFVKQEQHKALLTFLDGDFVEYNPNPKSHKIEKIEYSNILFDMEILENQSEKFDAKYENYSKPWQRGEQSEGKFEGTISDKSWNELKSLLDYVDFESLKPAYHVPWTCDQTANVKITYDNGKTISISDYGHKGTFALQKFHRLMWELRTNQNWRTKA
ncbi:DUF6438 domain-containing protein [Flavobacterium sp.]|uniref:DUF6438 domain-containing protein n=1 Tax=Flavobacterium sp. TaxID=239 RepID=UPI00121402D4|nr:DUF6438 domain-containing protein [Flavobacterium sp.]RZJ70592.1 MAG: hypothetical protein EOO49_13255 [Flavobacterium sp.]